MLRCHCDGAQKSENDALTTGYIRVEIPKRILPENPIGKAIKKAESQLNDLIVGVGSSR